MEQIVWQDDTGSTLDYREVIVRCRNCKHFKHHTGKFQAQRFRKDGVCKYHNYDQVMADDFCSKGET